ncbi:hypothetical protein [Marinoscillum sp. 108]|uniref:hypothetical protein n=1 Tax=Marinoscillum sp. 108 TaxID=2653151 RepID=UPI0012EFE1B7|nr:hypothetical protein [Marinoscillum sp. 108]VXD14860.1 conserved hypothetical protein [Marinoscillum sp. 108]
MGLFSKIKNYITGGAASVSVVFESPMVDGSAPIRLFVTAIAKDDCKIKKVYLNIRARETYIKTVTYTETDGDGNSRTSTRDETRFEDHFQKEMILATDLELKKGAEDKWLAEFELPEDTKATYHGKSVFFKWEFQAGLDMPGNDPDSGWVELLVSKAMNYTMNDL